MLYNLILLALGVGCVVLAIVCFIFVLPFIFESDDSMTDETSRKDNRIILVVATVIFLLTTAFAYVDFYYLAYNAPNYLSGFAAWYAVGFLTRVVYLIWSHRLLSSIYATESDDILSLFFIAIGGPLVLYFTLKEVIRQKGDPFHDINNLR